MKPIFSKSTCPDRADKLSRSRRWLASVMTTGIVVLTSLLVGCFQKHGQIIPPVAVTGVTLSKTTLTFPFGSAASTLTATVAPADAAYPSVIWSTSNAAVATVANGTVTPLAVGSATITVTTTDGGYTATCAVTVAPISVTGVTLNKTTLSLVAGGATGALTATVAPANATNPAVTWASSNAAVATVANGVVTPLTVGTSTITVSTVDGAKTATCLVTVSALNVPVTGVTVAPATLTLSPGTTKALTATVAPANASNTAVTWSSSATATATVSASGVVTAVGLGAANIIATTTDGAFTSNCVVTVSPSFYGFTATGLVYAKTGILGTWAQVGTNAAAGVTAIGPVVSNNGNDFYAITNTPTNGTIWQMTGPTGTWTNVGTQVASGTTKAAIFDGTNFYAFSSTGKYNTKAGVAGTWNAANGTGAGMVAFTGAFISGTNFLGFQATGELFTNPMATAATTNWTSVSTNTCPGTLVSVTTDGINYYGISSDGQLYQKTGNTGTWSNVSTNTAGVVLVAVIFH